MWRRFFNKAVSVYLKNRFSRLENIKRNPVFRQEQILMKLLSSNKGTEVGKRYYFNQIRDIETFRKVLPVNHYEDIKPDIDRMMSGEENVLVNGKVNWFAKSSGTTSARSKYIPVTDDYLRGNMIRASWDTTTLIYHNRPDARIFQKKSLVMGGSLSKWQDNPEITVGDVSAIMIKRIPFVGKPFYTPDIKIALLEDWEDKIEKMANHCIREDVVLFGGVPTWTLVLFEKILEATGKEVLADVWPNVRTYLHGGVGFGPYKDQFESVLGIKNFDFMEVYNASEGYFAVQDRRGAQDMLLLLDNEIFFEFIPAEEWDNTYPMAIGLEEVEIGRNYALVITNCSGLWRYCPGDTVIFTSKEPYRIQVSGRTKHFINVFGEEVMVANTDKALALTCNEYPAVIKDYTVGPIHLERMKKGGHLWLIEFENEPLDLSAFEKALDDNLRKINSDYDAKRFKNLALAPLKIEPVPKGTFLKWLRSKGKMGGQNKVPRLYNSRHYLEELLEFTK